MTRGLVASGVNWVSGKQTADVTANVKIRYRHPVIPARIVPQSSGKAEVWFQQSYPAVTPGQAVVFYGGDQVLGGGWIEKAL